MKRIIFFSIIALVLMGCGGGSSESVAATEQGSEVEQVDLGLDQNATESKNSDSILSESDTTSDLNTERSVSTNPYPAPFIGDEEKRLFLQAINRARAEGQDCGKIDSSGLPVKDSQGRYIYDGSNIMAPAQALKWNDTLYTAAYEHSNDLAESDTASHNGSGTDSDWTGMDMGGRKSTFVDRIRNNGYQFKGIGENISMGTHRDSITKAVKSWLKSPGHCVNLMNPLFTEVGVAHVNKEGTLYTNYWTQELGVPVQ